jgi:mannose-6-phosphate isomerase-like protein (cupin superfamily)
MSDFVFGEAEMSRRAFFVAGDRLFHIANPCNAGLSYQAVEHIVLPGTQLCAERQEQAETVLLVETGGLDVMVNGMTVFVSAGSFVRVPPRTWYAYRNEGSEPVRLLCRTSAPPPVRTGLQITVKIAAA